MDFDMSIERAVPIAFLLVFGLVHRSLRTRGFTLQSTIYSTDNVVSWILFLLIYLWTGGTLFVYVGRGVASDAQSWELSLAVPWIAAAFSLIWLLVNFESPLASNPPKWKMDCSNGPFGWRESLHTVVRRFIVIFLLPAITLSLLAIGRGHVVQGFLTIAACVMFTTGSFASNHYTQSPHRYAGDMLRVMLPTSHIEGTVYVLPSAAAGFTAVWSPKVEAEHKETDMEMMALFASMRTGRYSFPSRFGVSERPCRHSMNGAYFLMLRSLLSQNGSSWNLMRPLQESYSRSTTAQRPSHWPGFDVRLGPC